MNILFLLAYVITGVTMEKIILVEDPALYAMVFTLLGITWGTWLTKAKE